MLYIACWEYSIGKYNIGITRTIDKLYRPHYLFYYVVYNIISKHNSRDFLFHSFIKRDVYHRYIILC